MQKTFKNQQGREFLLLVVEQSAHDFKLNYHNDRVLYQDDECEAPFPPSKRIPQGNYQILCLAKDATEEQAKQIVEGFIKYDGLSKPISGVAMFKGYSDGRDRWTAKQSLTSLLTSLGFKQDDNVLILEKIN